MIPAGPTSRLNGSTAAGARQVLAGCLVGLLVVVTGAAVGGSTAQIAVLAGLGTAVGLGVLAGRRLVQVRVLLAGLVLIMLYIPARRYVFAVQLPFQLAPYRALILLILTVSFVVLLRNPSYGVRGGIAGWPFLLITIAVFSSEMLNGSRVNPLGSFVVKSLSQFLALVFVYFLAATFIRTRQQVDRFVKLLVIAASALALEALYESHSGFNIFDRLSFIPGLDFTGVVNLSSLERGGHLRVIASSEHPIALGAMFVLIVPLAMHLARRSRIWLVAVLLLVIGAMATTSRTAVLMLITLVVVYLIVRRRETARLWPLLIPALAAIHVALPGTIGTLYSSFTPKGGLIAQQSNIVLDQGVAGLSLRANGRLADIGPSIAEWSRKPAFGEGFGTRVIGYNVGFNNAAILDNQWLGIMLDTGAAGMAGWLWLFVRSSRRLLRIGRHDRSEDGWLTVAFAGAIIAYAVGMLTYDAFAFDQTTVVFVFILALGSAVVRFISEERTAAEQVAET